MSGCTVGTITFCAPTQFRDIAVVNELITIQAVAVGHGVAQGNILLSGSSFLGCECDAGDHASNHAQSKQHSNAGTAHSEKLFFHKFLLCKIPTAKAVTFYHRRLYNARL
jgi:hypothetical protein